MRRQRDIAMGLQCSDRAEADRWLKPTTRGERRWVARAEVRFDASFRARQLQPLDVQVINFSRFGCAIMGAIGPVDAYCWLTVPTLAGWDAKIAWENGRTIGLDFAEPFHRAVEEMILGRALRSQSSLLLP